MSFSGISGTLGWVRLKELSPSTDANPWQIYLPCLSRRSGCTPRKGPVHSFPLHVDRYFRDALLSTLWLMDIDNSATREVPRPLSTAAVRLGLEMDMMMKGVSDFSHRLSIPAECQDRIVLTKEHGASGDVEQMGDWGLDKRNPRNWPLSKKWAAVSVVSSPCRFFNWTLKYKYVPLRHDRYQLIPSSPLLSAP